MLERDDRIGRRCEGARETAHVEGVPVEDADVCRLAANLLIRRIRGDQSLGKAGPPVSAGKKTRQAREREVRSARQRAWCAATMRASSFALKRRRNVLIPAEVWKV